MFSIRLKLLLVLIIAGVLSVLFIQNQQLITLKFFCADLQAACLYRSPNLPLAVWIGGFVFTGVITSLVWQLLNSSNNTRSDTIRPQQYTSVKENDGYPSSSPDWEQPSQNDWNIETAPSEPTVGDRNFSSDAQVKTDYEVTQQPTSVQRSGSTYSFKYREAEAKQPDTSQVYDANYRTLNSSNPTDTNQPSSNDDEEDWV